MPQSHVQIPVHLVFSTRKRQPLLTDRSRRTEIHRYLFGICRNLGSPAICINGPEDHVHVLCLLGKEQRVCDLVRDLKSNSSKWVHRRFPGVDGFRWQKGYAAFGVNALNHSALVAYIKNQEEHHRRASFKEEFRKLCKEAGVQIDERYVWD